MFNALGRPPTERLKDNLKTFLAVKNSTLTTADLYFYGDIVSDWWGAWDDCDQYPEAIRDFLKEQEGKDLNIYINSGGGSVFAGLAIYNMLLRHKGKKTVYVDGVAASIASVIALAGDEVIVPSNAFMMIHKPWNVCVGNAADLRKAADDLDAVETGIINVYKDHLAEGAGIEVVKELVAAETWLNGEEAAKYFNVTVGGAKTYAAQISADNLKNYSNIPKEIIKAAQADSDNETVETAVQKIKSLVVQGISKGV